MDGNKSFIFSGKDEFRDDLISVAKKKDEILDLEKTLAAMDTRVIIKLLQTACYKEVLS